MKWIEILRKENTALLQCESDTQYAVVCGYDPNANEDEQWNHGTYFCYWNDSDRKVVYLQAALELFRCKTENNYISRHRLEELATKFKDECLNLCLDTCLSDEEFLSFVDDECEMEDYERQFFGISNRKE